MMYRLAIPMLLLSWLFAGCGPTQGGKWPAPVFNLAFGEITAPSAPVAHDEPMEFTVTWSNGRSPYEVEWYFAEGADPEALTSNITELMHTAQVTAVNETAEPIVYTGQVTITDMDDSQVVEPFSFTVNPAP